MIYYNKLISGAIGSAQLLMLSGIGPKKHLESHKIKVISDLEVGSNMQDHIGMGGLTFLINQQGSLVQNRYILFFGTKYRYIFQDNVLFDLAL